MNKVKIFVIATIFMISGFIMGACGSTCRAEQTHPLKIWFQNENGMCKTWNVVDEDTGVNYVVVTTWFSSGADGGRSCTITPRLNADGSLYTSK